MVVKHGIDFQSPLKKKKARKKIVQDNLTQNAVSQN